MLHITLSRAGTLCLALLLGISLVSEAFAQVNPRGNRGRTQAQQGQQAQQQSQQPDKPFIHGVYVGVGLNTYQGDLDSNPNNNILKHLGSANIDVAVGIDKRFGEFGQYGIGLTASFDRVTGQNIRNLEFTNNLVSLEVTGEYELPYIKQGLLRVFAGGGPMLVVSPTYSGFPEQDAPNYEFRELGTRVVGSIVAGVIIVDKVRIGARITTTDFLDGHTGLDRQGPIDMLSFINIGYRFDLTD